MPDLQLVISFDPTTGALGIGGAPEVLGNQVLAFGMLESAKVAMIQNAIKSENRITPATMLPPPGFPGGK